MSNVQYIVVIQPTGNKAFYPPSSVDWVGPFDSRADAVAWSEKTRTPYYTHRFIQLAPPVAGGGE